MKTLYLIAAVLGAVVPYVFFVDFLTGADTSLGAFASQLFATAPAGGFASDLFITSAVFWVWSYGEARRVGPRGGPVVCVPALPVRACRAGGDLDVTGFSER